MFTFSVKKSNLRNSGRLYYNTNTIGQHIRCLQTSRKRTNALQLNHLHTPKHFRFLAEAFALLSSFPHALGYSHSYPGEIRRLYFSRRFIKEVGRYKAAFKKNGLI